MGRIFQGGREDARGQSELGVVGHGQRFVVVGDLDHRGDRTEDLFDVDRVARLRARDERGSEEIPVRVRVDELTAGDLPAFGSGLGDVIEVLVELGLGDHGSDGDAFGAGVSDGQGRHLLLEQADEFVVDIGSDDEAGGRGAALAGGEEGSVDRGLGGRFEIGVAEHDERVLPAHLALHSDLVCRGRCDDGSSDGDGSGEGHGVDLRRGGQCVPDHGTRPHNEVEDPIGQSRLGEDVGECIGAGGDEFGRFEHDRIAEGQGRGDLPGRDGDGEVPRSDDADDADGLVRHLGDEPGADRVDDLTGVADGLAGEELEDLGGAQHLALGFGELFALFPGEQIAEFVGAFGDEAAGLVEDCESLLCAEARPGGGGSAGGIDRRGDRGGIRAGKAADHIGRIGRVRIRRPVLTGHPCAADEVVEDGVGPVLGTACWGCHGCSFASTAPGCGAHVVTIVLGGRHRVPIHSATRKAVALGLRLRGRAEPQG